MLVTFALNKTTSTTTAAKKNNIVMMQRISTRLSSTTTSCCNRRSIRSWTRQNDACHHDHYHHPRLRFRPFSSVSNSEVSKFSKFAETWWNPTHNPLIGMNTIRMNYIIQQQQKLSRNGNNDSLFPLENLNALDIGCGGGLLSESLARLGANVTAIDPSEELVQQAQRHASLDPRTQSIDYRGGWSVEQLTQEYCGDGDDDESKQKFDIICLLEVIEHVTDPESVLKATRALLKPNGEGKLYLSTMNRTMKSKLVAIVGAEYVMRYLPVGTHDWNKFLSPNEVEQLMESSGFIQTDVCGMIIDSPPLGGKWNWKLDPNDTDINWIGTYQLKEQ